MVSFNAFSNISADKSTQTPYDQWFLWSSDHIGLLIVEPLTERQTESADFQIVAANPTMMRSGLFLSDSPVGQSLGAVFSGRQADEQRRCYQQCLNGQITPLIVSTQTSDRASTDESVRWWQLTPSIATPAATSPARLVIVATDISQQQRALHHS